MIITKQDLQNTMILDSKALGKNGKLNPKLFDYVWRWQILYRKYEYHSNSAKNALDRIIVLPYKIRFSLWSLVLGFSIPINVFESGLSIAHYGTIVINENAKIGKNCRIQEGVTIGSTNGEKEAPKIGDNVFIGSGAKIIGNICIADDVCIGAGSVVVKDVLEKGITVAGVPARKISENNSHRNINRDVIRD